MIYLKQYDTGYGLENTLTNESGAVDLTDATVKFYMSDFEIQAQIEDATNGKVLVFLDKGHTEKTGKHRAEFKVTYNDGRVETFPSRDYIQVMIMKSVGGN